MSSPETPPDLMLRDDEQNAIDSAILQAFENLPVRLVEEMSTIPPATEEVARLYKTSIEVLRQERRQAVNMIAVHSLMRAVNEVRDEVWSRQERNDLSAQIDDYAQRKILELLNDRAFTDSLKKFVPQPVNHYALGVSEREKHVLTRITQTLMSHCLADIPEPTEEIDWSRRPLKELEEAYVNINAAMRDAFCNMFFAFDQKVRKGSLIGVDHEILDALDDLVPYPKTPTDIPPIEDAWLQQQKKSLLDALEAGCRTYVSQSTTGDLDSSGDYYELPPETRDAWKRAYAQQFEQFSPKSQRDPNQSETLLIDPDLQQIYATAFAFYEVRRKRLLDAKQAPKDNITPEQATQWITEALDGLESVLGPHEDNSVTPDTTNEARFLDRGIFSDLREAYEFERSGVPWKDTRRQESIEKIAGPMIAQLSFAHRAGVLDALADHGEDATNYMRSSGNTFESMPLRAAVITREMYERRYGLALERQRATQSQRPYKFTPHDASQPFVKGALRASDAIRKRVRISPRDAGHIAYTARHEGTHLLDYNLAQASSRTGWWSILSRLNLLPDSRYYSEQSKLISEEHRSAEKQLTGLHSYVEYDPGELFAEVTAAMQGSPNIRYETQYREPMADVYSPKNAEARHPETFKRADELFRKRFDVEAAEQSIAHRSERTGLASLRAMQEPIRQEIEGLQQRAKALQAQLAALPEQALKHQLLQAIDEHMETGNRLQRELEDVPRQVMNAAQWSATASDTQKRQWLADQSMQIAIDITNLTSHLTICETNLQTIKADLASLRAIQAPTRQMIEDLQQRSQTLYKEFAALPIQMPERALRQTIYQHVETGNRLQSELEDVPRQVMNSQRWNSAASDVQKRQWLDEESAQIIHNAHNFASVWTQCEASLQTIQQQSTQVQRLEAQRDILKAQFERLNSLPEADALLDSQTLRDNMTRRQQQINDLLGDVITMRQQQIGQVLGREVPVQMSNNATLQLTQRVQTLLEQSDSANQTHAEDLTLIETRLNTSTNPVIWERLGSRAEEADRISALVHAEKIPVERLNTALHALDGIYLDTTRTHKGGEMVVARYDHSDQGIFPKVYVVPRQLETQVLLDLKRRDLDLREEERLRALIIAGTLHPQPIVGKLQFNNALVVIIDGSGTKNLTMAGAQNQGGNPRIYAVPPEIQPDNLKGALSGDRVTCMVKQQTPVSKAMKKVSAFATSVIKPKGGQGR